MTVGTPHPVGIESSAAITALGDVSATYEGLLKGEVALQKIPVLGKDGGDPVPLGLIGEQYDETVPPRWLDPLDALVAQVPDAPWGDVAYPIFLTSSNYDVGSLYTYRHGGDEKNLDMGTPGRTLEKLAAHYGWGSNRVALSHACVTAQVAIEMATRRLQDGFAKKALIVSFDFVSPFVAGGFHSLKILNEQMPAPFMKRDTGSIGLGDGAAFLVLSLEESPVQIVSNFLYNEMYHFTSNEPSGSGFDEVSKWIHSEVGEEPIWLKGHGTGTLDAGKLESESLARCLPHSPLVSWKGSIGHTLGSCAAVEMAIVVECLRRGLVPPCLDVGVDAFTETVATKAFSARDYRYAALVSNAFGGAHAGCIVRYE